MFSNFLHQQLSKLAFSGLFRPFRPFLRQKGKKVEKVLDLKRSESLDLIKAKRQEKPTEKVQKRSQKVFKEDGN
jgi:hypothetical protein